MEAALRKLMEESFGEYVKGGLGSVEASGFPLTLRDLKLNEKRIQEDMEEDGNGMPFELTSGKIGSISVNPGWMGVEIVASSIVLNLSFSAVKAMAWMMRPKDADEGDESPEQEFVPRPAPAPPPPVAPRYCCAHGTSEQRTKAEPRFEECKHCHLRLQTNYAEFSYCPPCSEHLERCMLCGSNAPTAGSYVPSQHLQLAAGVGAEPNGAALPPPPPPARFAPRFCSAHCTSEKRTKGEPKQMECTDCHTAMQTNYTEFALCPTCSNRQERCMICGAGAPASSSSAPPPWAAEARSAPELPEAALPNRDPEQRPAAAAASAEANAEPPMRSATAHPAAEEEDPGPVSPTPSRPLARGGFREGSRPPEKRWSASQMGCGLPCAVGGPNGDGIMGFFRIFDFGSWSHCQSQCGGGGVAAVRQDVPEEYSPKRVPARGGA